jgi:hypothetical protein
VEQLSPGGEALAFFFPAAAVEAEVTLVRTVAVSRVTLRMESLYLQLVGVPPAIRVGMGSINWKSCSSREALVAVARTVLVGMVEMVAWHVVAEAEAEGRPAAEAEMVGTDSQS